MLEETDEIKVLLIATSSFDRCLQNPSIGGERLARDKAEGLTEGKAELNSRRIRVFVEISGEYLMQTSANSVITDREDIARI